MSPLSLSRRVCTLIVISLASLLVHCRNDEEASVELRIVSDLVPFYEVGIATATLFDGVATATTGVGLVSVERALSEGEPLGRGLWLASFDGIPHGTYTAWVTLRRENGETLGRRPLTFTVQNDASFTVTITADCVNVECPDGTSGSLLACVAGQCVDPRCTAETPSYCPAVAGAPFFCVDGSTCPALSPCAEGMCESGACLQVPAFGECGDGEFCSAISGCTSATRPENAPDDAPGTCGDPCVLLDSPCAYSFVVCTGDLARCEPISRRPAGSPCPGDGICRANGECETGARDGGVPDASTDMDLAIDANDPTATEDMNVEPDAVAQTDMSAAIDSGAPLDMGATPCPSGFLGTIETGCYDIDECTYNVCDVRTTCTNAPGTFSCSRCPSGFAGSGETGCDLENGCDEDPCDPLTVCNATGLGTFECSPCPRGYVGTGARGCFDINECTYNVCDALAACENTDGGFSCASCPPGYTGTGATGCDDRDECLEGACSELAGCTNTPGSFECGDCPGGFVGDGTTCEDLDECATGRDDCAAGTCINRIGSYLCRTVTRVTVAQSPLTEEANRDSPWGTISSDGTKVAFVSVASNLVSVYLNDEYHVFVKDLLSGATTLVSAAADGTPGVGESSVPQFSPDGTKVAFQSYASNLVAGDTNGQSDIFVKDLVTGVVVRVSVNASGTEGNGESYLPRFSPDGSKVLFSSDASNLAPGHAADGSALFLKDLSSGVLTPISVAEDGTPADRNSGVGRFSADGAFVIFESDASNLVANDTNDRRDVFIKHLATGAVTRISVSADGAEGNGSSFGGEISPDGTKATFYSSASNLVPGDTNGVSDTFVADLSTGVIVRVSEAQGGTQANGASAVGTFGPDGTEVLFSSNASNLVPGDTNGVRDIFARHLGTGAVRRVSVSAAGTQSNGESLVSEWSIDGSVWLFVSRASNLVADDTNGALDVFVKDAASGAVTRVTTFVYDTQAEYDEEYESEFSPDGTSVLFVSYGSTFVPRDTNGGTDVFIKDLQTGAITLVSVDEDGFAATGHTPQYSPDGSKVIFGSHAPNLVADDTNGSSDIFTRDLINQTTTLVSVTADGTQADCESRDPAFASDGIHVAFRSCASNLVDDDNNGNWDIFVKDLASGAVTRVSVAADGTEADGNSYAVTFSPDGTKVAFVSAATNLVPGDDNGAEDIFVKDLTTNAITRISVDEGGTQANERSFAPRFGPNGAALVFSSLASNLVSDDTNGAADIFMKDLTSGVVTRLSVAEDGTEADGSSASPRLSSNGRLLVFESSATNLIAGDTNLATDVFVRNLDDGSLVRVSVTATGVQANRDSIYPSISRDGTRVVFGSWATNLVEGDTNGTWDVFVVANAW